MWMIELLTHPASIIALCVFVVAYIFVLTEEIHELKKSKPVIIGAGLIWICVAIVVHQAGMDPELLHDSVHETISEYGSLFLFLLVAMTYISALQERQVFEALRSKLISSGLSYRQLFWVTGTLAFFISPVADNMTTALVMGAVVMALAPNNRAFVAASFVNVVSAANAGGAFSPFGDITTLMVWQAGHIPFFDFLKIFLPSVAAYVIPAACMSLFIEKGAPEKLPVDIPMKRGAKRIILLGFLTLATAVSFEQLLELPSFLGMMLGLGVLMIFGFYLHRTDEKEDFDVHKLMDGTEWDTLLFFFGIIFCISGLGFLGYLEFASNHLYGSIGIETTNIIMGLISAVVDNIPLMFAVLQMDPDMNEFQWLLVTLTLGTGGSMLSIGSAAGVALMGLSKGRYTFLGHLKYTPYLLIGYFCAIAVHYWVNADLIDLPQINPAQEP
jgi:Na+/H+ antiporter NhaD/arsenite permease-like protein